MNNSLAPTYQRLFGEYWVLWYKASNSYSIVEPEFKRLLDSYLKSDNKKIFVSKLALEDKFSNPNTILENIHTYLNNCNKTITAALERLDVIDLTKRSLLKHYLIKGKTIQIYYDSELVLNTIHPALAHHTIKTSDSVQITFDIYVKNGQLHLYKNEQLISCVPKHDYHLIQGKFIMQLLCTIHNKNEADWLGTFHGSTITDGNTSILFVGESGKGKSTLCALLASAGFNLLADDVSPMLSQIKKIFHNPSAISIKEGAFNLLQPLVETFEDLPIVQFNKRKGLIKYMPCKHPKKDSYPCDAIIIVNYKDMSKTLLERASIKTLLETLIPDSWLSPNPIHAKEFLDWLETLNIYQLTYSDTKSVTAELSKLFKQLNKN